MDRETTPTALGMKRGLPALAARWFSQSLSALWVLRSHSERVSLVYRNDDGVNVSTESTVFRVDAGDSIAHWPGSLAKRGACRLPHFFRISLRNAAINSEYPDTAFCALLAERLMPADDRVTRRELMEIGQIPRHCWFRAPRHYSASHCSDAASNRSCGMELGIKPSATTAVSLIRYPV